MCLRLRGYTTICATPHQPTQAVGRGPWPPPHNATFIACATSRPYQSMAPVSDSQNARDIVVARHTCWRVVSFAPLAQVLFMWKSGHISPGATDSAQILSCLGRAHHPATAAMATLHSMCTRSSSDTYALLVRAYLPASRALATVSSRTPTRPLRLSRRTGHGRRATCRVEDLHTAWHAHQRGQRPCSQLLATNLSFLNPPKLQLLSPLHCPSLPHIAAIQART